MRTSIRDVAEQAGVSAVTVSNVLRGRTGRTSAATRARVLKAAKELQYVPVSQPVTQKRRAETRVIGLVFDGTPAEGPWGTPTFSGMREAAAEQDYDLLTVLRTPPKWMEGQEELQFLDKRCDGLIFLAPCNKRRLLEKLVEHQLPVITCFTEDAPPQVPTVVLDNKGAMQQTVEHVVARGHQHILHLTTHLGRSDFHERQEGFNEAMKQSGKTPLSLCVDNITEEKDIQLFLHTIKEHQITAVVCSADGLAYAVWNIAEANGMNVPQDLSITGMDNISKGDPRPLTTIHYSCEEVGRQVVNALTRHLKGGDVQPHKIVLPVHLIERSSVGIL